MAKGNKGLRLVPEIAALVNVQWFVLPVCLAPALWEAAGCVAFLFLMFVSELVLEEAEFTPGLCSREGGTWLTGKGLYQRRAFV